MNGYGVVAIAAVVSLGSACQGPAPSDISQTASTAPAPSVRSLPPQPAGGSALDFAFHFDDFADFAAAPTAVFTGRVLAESRGPATGDAELRRQNRVLQMQVDEVLLGTLPDRPTLRVEDLGYVQIRGRPEQIDAPAGYLRVERGDEGVFSVWSDGEVYGFTNDQAVFLTVGDEVRETGRSDAFITMAEALSRTELIERIGEAAAAQDRAATEKAPG